VIIIGIVLSFVVFAYLCWVLFTLAVHALPFFVGMTAGLAVYHGGMGPIAAILAGTLAGSVTFIAGQTAFTKLRSPGLRTALALLFTVPATVAGYHASRGLAHLILPAGYWHDVIAIAGATIVAATAFMRMWLSPPSDTEQGVAAGLTSSRPPVSQTSEA